MGIGFREFLQTPRGRGFSLLGFIPYFKHFVNVSVDCGLERPFDRFQTLEPKCLDLRPTNSPYSVLRTVWVKCVMNGATNYVLVSLRP